ncbi:MAG: amidohydrolase family protein [Microthrixaceae bacterium]
MTKRPDRIVDCHVHLWDPARTDWYPYLASGQAPEIGDSSGMARLFDVPTYLAESAGWNVTKLVNVAAATGVYSIEETLELDRRANAEGHPDAIIGGVVHTSTDVESLAQIDRQMSAERFRGVRPMGRTESPLPSPEVLAGLQERGLLFELMAHPDRLSEAAALLEPFEDLVVVVEHAGWPRSSSSDEWKLWAEGLAQLEALGERIVCKLSGLAMPTGSMRTDDLRPWIDHAISTFGVPRCMFASNFPVDGLHGTFDQLYTAFSEITSTLDDGSRDRLFATNAERVYRC